jgi:NADH-quinone oxidoreductase subunit J
VNIANYLFLFFSTLMLVSALFVVTVRNPVHAAMHMIVTFVSTAALFVLLESYLLAALQVLVYAGAIVVLLLFIIMLLNVDKLEKTRPYPWALVGGSIGFSLLVAGVFNLFLTRSASDGTVPTVASSTAEMRFVAYELFGKYQLPFEITGFLLLMTMIGVIALSQRNRVRKSAATKSEVL